jgi:hypothetical protein
MEVFFQVPSIVYGPALVCVRFSDFLSVHDWGSDSSNSKQKVFMDKENTPNTTISILFSHFQDSGCTCPTLWCGQVQQPPAGQSLTSRAPCVELHHHSTDTSNSTTRGNHNRHFDKEIIVCTKQLEGMGGEPGLDEGVLSQSAR